MRHTGAQQSHASDQITGRGHHVVKNVNAAFDERLTVGERVSDRVTRTVGSWRFIIIQSCVLCVWIVLNVVAFVQHWDPYPFILLNLMLSFQAAYTAPIIMMSQNREAMKDRVHADVDYQVNVRAEQELAELKGKLDTLFQHLTADRWDTVFASQDEQLALLRRVHEVVCAAQADGTSLREGGP